MCCEGWHDMVTWLLRLGLCCCATWESAILTWDELRWHDGYMWYDDGDEWYVRYHVDIDHNDVSDDAIELWCTKIRWRSIWSGGWVGVRRVYPHEDVNGIHHWHITIDCHRQCRHAIYAIPYRCTPPLMHTKKTATHYVCHHDNMTARVGDIQTLNMYHIYHIYMILPCYKNDNDERMEC